ncbi:MAG: hypothetical protein K2V38_09360 [Gemmataceae bacterium]|nr:hypothetical protein [Gemmataceae bacterium]
MRAKSENARARWVEPNTRRRRAKKVLEWSGSASEAYRTLEHPNNKYAIDGRDPNSHTGILWYFGLFEGQAR